MNRYEDDDFIYMAQQETDFNDERYPSSMATSSYFQRMQLEADAVHFRPKTSQSFLSTRPTSSISMNRPTSEAFSLTAAATARKAHQRWQSNYTVALPSGGGTRVGTEDDDDNLDAFITDEYEDAKRARIVKRSHCEIPVTRRTWKQWGQRVAIYLSIIAFFSGFHLGMWALFWASVDLNNPAFSHYILLEPALNFRPKPRGDDWGTFLQWNRRDMPAIYQLMDSMNEAVERYEEERLDDPNGDHHTWTKVCDFDNIADDENACWIDTRSFGTYCYKSQLYGFNDGKPCILIRINKLVNWVPVSYDSYAELKAAGFPLTWKEEDFTPGFVPISCEGYSDIDKELLGPMRYHYPLRPYNGLASYYFPFTGQLHYAPPGVMVNFYNITFAVPIKIVCKLWAKNVRHRREGPLGQLSGAVEFELMIDSGMVGQEERP